MSRSVLVPALAVCALAFAPSLAAADEEYNLTPYEQATADVIVAPAPNTVVDATVVPEGCSGADDDSCAYTVHADGQQQTGNIDEPPTETAPVDAPATTRGVHASAKQASRPAIVTMSGAKVSKVRVRTRTRPHGAQAQTRAGMRAWWVQNDDHVCSVAGCFGWELQLNSKAYCDGTYAWGSRSRYGYAGYANKNGTQSHGWSVSTSVGFSGDPSIRDLFAYNDGKITSSFKVPGSQTHYVHRHYPGNCGNSWVVGG